MTQFVLWIFISEFIGFVVLYFSLMIAEPMAVPSRCIVDIIFWNIYSFVSKVTLRNEHNINAVC